MNNNVIKYGLVFLIGFLLFPIISKAEYLDTINQFYYKGLTLPAYNGNTCRIINNNNPTFTNEEKAAAVSPFEKYSNLDSIGRSGVAYASLDETLMPTWTRGSISSIYPTGWVQASYNIVPGTYLYNRSHLIGFQLTGVDNVNLKKPLCAKDLITGTRYMNVGISSNGMVQYENQVANYIKNNHGKNVLYRVTPVFTGNDLLAKGVLMEGESVEGTGIKFFVFCYNVQPGVSIDYTSGQSKITESVTEIPVNTQIPAVDKTPPSAPIWSKVKTKKKSLYLQWKPVSKAKGYQITYRKMGPNKYKNKYTTNTKITLKKLASKKKHQVKVRAYRIVDGKTIYGKYSKVKKIKVK